MNLLALFPVFAIALFIPLSGLWFSHQKTSWEKNVFLQFFLTISTGLLLAIIFVEFSPHAFKHYNQWTGAIVALGILCTLFLDSYVIPFLHKLQYPRCDRPSSHNHVHSHNLISHEAACCAVGCLVVCTFFDGVSIQSAFQLGNSIGWTTSLGLFFHLLPDGILASGLMLAGGSSKKSASLVSILLSFSLLGGIFTVLLLESIISFDAYILPFTTGVLTYVVTTHLLPISIRVRLGFWGICLGFAFQFFLHLGFH